MSEIPNTENVVVAAIAAAGEIAKRPADGAAKDFFTDRLKRFLSAYKAIMTAYAIGSRDPFSIDVDKIISDQK